MGEQIINTGNEIKGRWMGKMPRFFRQLVKLAASVIVIVFAINSGVPALGGTLHPWWSDVYTYIISACIGIIVTCKMTVAGGYKEIDPDKVIRGGHIVDRDSTAPNMSDIETQSADTEPHEIEPVNSSVL